VLTAGRVLWATVSLCFLVPVVSTWASPGMPSSLRLASAAILVITAARPLAGLLLLAVAMPLGTYLWAFTHPTFDSAAVVELLLAPFLVSAGLRLAGDRRLTESVLAPPAMLFGAIVMASGAIGLAAQQQSIAFSDVFLADLWRHAWRSYFDEPGAFIDLHIAAGWIEGLALAVCAECLLRGDARAARWVMPALLAGATGAAVTTWIRYVQISLRQPHPVSAALQFLQSPRINTLYTDVNAAGSLYAMYLAPAVWLAIRAALNRSGATEDRVRALRSWYWLPVVTISLALWLTHSRAAVVAPFVSVGLLWLIALRPSRLTLAIGGAIGAVLLLGLVLFSPTRSTQSSSTESFSVRLHMAHIALQLTAEQPAFGIGVGQFRRASQQFMTPDFIARFPQAGVGENAHNNFLQILAELGIVGFLGFGWLIVEPAGVLTRAVRTATASPSLLAASGGVLAFLLTCLLGHPLLIVQVLWIFMLVFGVATGLAPGVMRPWRGRIAAVLAAAVLVSLPIRILAVWHTADLSRVVIGAGPPVDLDDNIVHRIAESRSRWFVTSRARALEIPLRLTSDSNPPCLVRIEIDGHLVNTVRPMASGWMPVTLQLDPSSRDPRSRQVDLTVEGARCHLKVGRFTTRE
jgi:O-antigen ligase